MPDGRPDNPIRRLVITSVKEVASGQGQKGEWHLYEIGATKEDGEPVSDVLKSFTKLALGPSEFEIERQEHEKYGVSFLLKPRRGARMEALEKQVADLTQRVELCERALSGNQRPPLSAAEREAAAQQQPAQPAPQRAWQNPDPPF